MQLEVTLVGKTMFIADNAEDATDHVWEMDDNSTDGASLAEFAGRACYQSWKKPNPKTAANADYLAHIQGVGHWSVLEHGTITFYIKGVSRSLTHELIRHRHLSPSQLSQRFVVLNPDVAERTTDDFVVPPLFAGNRLAETVLEAAWEASVNSYGALMRLGEVLARDRGLTGTVAIKTAREAARAVLPNMTPTAIVLTGNHRAWREMLMMRLQPEADAEIRTLAMELFKQLSAEEPALYQDLQVITREGEASLEKIDGPS